MVDPATSAGLVLAVIPLMISALENYEYTFKVISFNDVPSAEMLTPRLADHHLRKKIRERGAEFPGQIESPEGEFCQ
jgi:hypothetical protein